jgi:hypothetical protein
MRRLSLCMFTFAGLTLSHSAVWAIQDEGAGSGKQAPTRASIHALANTNESVRYVPESQMRNPKTAVRNLANAPASRGNAANARREAVEDEREARGNNRVRPEGAEYPAIDRARGVAQMRQPGFLPFGFNEPFVGFGPGGFVSSRPIGYRTFPYTFGNPYGFANGYFIPSFGFGPIAFGLSGPKTTLYDDPMGRQWKMMYDGMKNFDFATGRRTTNP